MDINTFSLVDKDEVEKRDIEEAIKTMMSSSQGKVFFKYLLKEFKVGELPPVGMEGPLLHDYLGFCRAGSNLFDIIINACPVETALILADIIKENRNV